MKKERLDEKSIAEDEIENKWTGTYRGEDNLTKLIDLLDWLKK